LKSEVVKRRYDASRRQAQSRQLRLEVAGTALALFIERGFAATTIGDVAAAAGVSQQFIYAAFGGKRGLLSKVVDWTLVGDDEPIPMAHRPSIIAIQQERTITGKCALHARHVRLVAPRISPLVQMLRAAADADADARAIYETSEEQRRTGAALFVANLRTAGDVRTGLTDQQAAEALWALTPDILWTALVSNSGWTPDDFQVWYAGLVAAAVLEDRQIAAVRRFSRTLIDAQPHQPR
jgi:AcrR family transcriptional regulator